MFYNDLDGGILEAFGRLLRYNVRIYVYPSLHPQTGEVITAENLQARHAAAQGLGFRQEGWPVSGMRSLPASRAR